MNISEISRLFDKAKNIFFVGIGGISMSSIAFILKARGFSVRGSDRVESEMVKKLREAGITVHIGHRAENIALSDMLIYTGAVNFDNAELAAAKDAGIPLVYRADALAYLSLGHKRRIGISGSHGKSTATAMLSHILLSAGKEPCVMCGATVPEMGGAYRIGTGDDFVFEACEYKDSFLSFLPNIAVILNIDLDHTDYFAGGLAQIKESFRKYAEISLRDGGTVIANGDDENTADALSGTEYISFGLNDGADYRAVNITFEKGRARFTVLKRGGHFCDMALSVAGAHNIYNALAACAAADSCGVDAEQISKSIGTFGGLDRRFQYKGACGGADIYIDYAHHPREIKASLSAARECTKGDIYCVFEPHTYSRTAALFDDFAAAFDGAKKVFFVDIYAAREQNTYGVSSASLAEKCPVGEYTPSYEDAVRALLENVRAGDMMLILGAGTVERIAGMIK